MKLFVLKKLNFCRIAVFSFLLSAAFSALQANDTDANAAYQEGLEKYAAGQYYPAAKQFLAAELLADSASLKAEALKETVNSYRQAKMYYKEFECVERLLNYYPSFIDFPKMVDREYEIGDEYYHGYRDPEFWALRWVPWLTGPDRAIEIYEKALKHAPFASNAPQAKLRAAVLLIETGKVDKAMEFLREIIKQHPDSPECKYAYLELGNALFQLSQKGDGDGKYNREALEIFNAFLTKYPTAPEGDFVKKCLLKSKDINAQRLLGMAKFYQRIGRTEPAERYLNDVLKQYPDSLEADKSETMLAKIDKTYVPEGFRPEVESRNQSFKQIPIPPEASPIMVVPENSDGKWLLPIRDLGIGKKDEKASK